MNLLYFARAEAAPLGTLWLAASPAGLVALDFPTTRARFTSRLEKRFKCPLIHDAARLAEAAEQLREYAAGKRRAFSIVVDWSVLRPYQRLVLQATAAIPYGETRTYKEIAVLLGNLHAARAVGRAEATNPMPIVLPCHRVLGSDNRLHGYGAGEGVKTKDWLLRLEQGLL